VGIEGNKRADDRVKRSAILVTLLRDMSAWWRR